MVVVPEEPLAPDDPLVVPELPLLLGVPEVPDVPPLVVLLLDFDPGHFVGARLHTLLQSEHDAALQVPAPTSEQSLSLVHDTWQRSEHEGHAAVHVITPPHSALDAQSASQPLPLVRLHEPLAPLEEPLEPPEEDACGSSPTQATSAAVIARTARQESGALRAVFECMRSLNAGRVPNGSIFETRLF